MLNKILMVAVVVLSVLFAWKNFQVSSLQSELTDAVFSRDSVVQINDSTTAFLAQTFIDKNSIANELAAAKELNATLVATTTVRVITDTVYRDRVEVVTTTDSVGERVAVVHDSTAVGVLDAVITLAAAPDTTIGFEYTFAPSPLSLQISLLQTRNNKAIFLVTYSGGEVEVEAPYAELIPPPKRFSWYVQAGYGSAWLVRGGGAFRLFDSLYLFSELDKRFNNAVVEADTGNDIDLFFGLMKRF